MYLFIATGSHSPPNNEIIRERILKDQLEVWKDRIWLHDCDNVEMHQDLGLSEYKTPIKIDKRVLSACLRIALSDSEYHYFAGVAGSVKFFVPGSAARETIRHNTHGYLISILDSKLNAEWPILKAMYVFKILEI